MGGLLLCGKRTTNPYYIKEAGINIYSIEELCYYLYNNTYMVGPEFFCEELTQFVSKELELPSLGQRLKQRIDYKDTLDTMVMEVLTSVAYYSHEECKGIEETIKALGSKSKPERMKARADMLLDRRKYVSAANAYKDILNNHEEVYEGSFVANIWNNLGVVYAKQFLFADAVNCFKMACDIDRKEEYFDNMVCSAIFSRDDGVLGDITAQYQISDGMLEQYMDAIESSRRMMVDEKEFMELKDKLKYDGSIELAAFNDDIRRILERWKEEYRQTNV